VLGTNVAVIVFFFNPICVSMPGAATPQGTGAVPDLRLRKSS
jgi:hypothetical protein